jgi:FAD:protein FMN transferase
MPSGQADVEPSAGAATLHHLEHVMGTVVTFDIHGGGGRGHDSGVYAHLARARALLQRYDAMFSLWKPNSPMSRLRRGEISLDEAPPEVALVLDLCSDARRATRGWFHAFALPGGVDPTGLVKGWAAQQALSTLAEAGYGNCMVNAGGDVATAGHPDGLDAWRIGIQHPASRAHLLGVVAVTGAIATSGTYERGAHLTDPHTGRPRSRCASATVVGPDLAMADALATGLAVAGDEGFDFIETLAGYEAYAVLAGGVTRASTGWRFAPAHGPSPVTSIGSAGSDFLGDRSTHTA